MGILSTVGVTRAYKLDADHCVRTVLNLMRKRYGIGMPHDITLEMWEAWGRDTDLMRTLTDKIAKYAAGVNFHTPAYVERLSDAEKDRIAHLLLPPLPHYSGNAMCPWLSIARLSGDGAKRRPMCSVSAPLRFWR
jgi:hypothetical protein